MSNITNYPDDILYNIYNYIPTHQCKYCRNKFKSFEHSYCSNKCTYFHLERMIVELLSISVYFLMVFYFIICFFITYLSFGFIIVKYLFFS